MTNLDNICVLTDSYNCFIFLPLLEVSQIGDFNNEEMVEARR